MGFLKIWVMWSGFKFGFSQAFLTYLDNAYHREASRGEDLLLSTPIRTLITHYEKLLGRLPFNCLIVIYMRFTFHIILVYVVYENRRIGLS